MAISCHRCLLAWPTLCADRGQLPLLQTLPFALGRPSRGRPLLEVAGQADADEAEGRTSTRRPTGQWSKLLQLQSKADLNLPSSMRCVRGKRHRRGCQTHGTTSTVSTWLLNSAHAVTLCAGYRRAFAALMRGSKS